MFAMECASELHECAAARLMSKLLTIYSSYNGCYRAKCIAVWYARQAIPKHRCFYLFDAAPMATDSYVDECDGAGLNCTNGCSYSINGSLQCDCLSGYIRSNNGTCEGNLYYTTTHHHYDTNVPRGGIDLADAFGIRIRIIYLVLVQTQDTPAKTTPGRCRRGHLETIIIFHMFSECGMQPAYLHLLHRK